LRILCWIINFYWYQTHIVFYGTFTKSVFLDPNKRNKCTKMNDVLKKAVKYSKASLLESSLGNDFWRKKIYRTRSLSINFTNIINYKFS